jgi:hypothetical protein
MQGTRVAAGYIYLLAASLVSLGDFCLAPNLVQSNGGLCSAKIYCRMTVVASISDSYLEGTPTARMLVFWRAGWNDAEGNGPNSKRMEQAFALAGQFILISRHRPEDGP